MPDEEKVPGIESAFSGSGLDASLLIPAALILLAVSL